MSLVAIFILIMLAMYSIIPLLKMPTLLKELFSRFKVKVSQDGILIYCFYLKTLETILIYSFTPY